MDALGGANRSCGSKNQEPNCSLRHSHIREDEGPTPETESRTDVDSIVKVGSRKGARNAATPAAAPHSG